MDEVSKPLVSDEALATFLALGAHIRSGVVLSPDILDLYKDLLARLDRTGDYEELKDRVAVLENKFTLLTPTEVGRVRRGL